MNSLGRPYFPEDEEEDGEPFVSLDEFTLHEESFGVQNEFFDDHQKWVVDAFDSL